MGHKTLWKWYIEFYRLTKKYLMISNHRGLIFLLIITSMIILTSCAVEQKKKPVTDSLNKLTPQQQYECSKIRDEVYRLKSRINQSKQHQLRPAGTDSEAEIAYQRAIENNERSIENLYLRINRLESRAFYIGCTR